MSKLVTDCPRCGVSKMTFEVMGSNELSRGLAFEVFAVCGSCARATIFQCHTSTAEAFTAVSGMPIEALDGVVNKYLGISGYVNIKDLETSSPPEYVPKNIGEVFREASTCFAIECFNAAGTMFRLCIDLATKPLMPPKDIEGLNPNIRRNLGLRLPWLFNTDRLPKELRQLSSCIKDDGNDGAHAGTLKKVDAEDLLDFTYAFLERLYTESERLAVAEKRRKLRRSRKKK